MTSFLKYLLALPRTRWRMFGIYVVNSVEEGTGSADVLLSPTCRHKSSGRGGGGEPALRGSGEKGDRREQRGDKGRETRG